MTDLDAAILAFERACPTWLYQGEREVAIRERFGLSATAYHQRLVALLRDPEAEAAEPATVRRLRRVVEGRLARRARWRAVA